VNAKAAHRNCAKAPQIRRRPTPGDRSRRRNEAIVEAWHASPAHRQCKTPELPCDDWRQGPISSPTLRLRLSHHDGK
jgi:hypothetical protein